jgi:hypothetical protein
MTLAPTEPGRKWVLSVEDWQRSVGCGGRRRCRSRRSLGCWVSRGTRCGVRWHEWADLPPAQDTGSLRGDLLTLLRAWAGQCEAPRRAPIHPPLQRRDESADHTHTRAGRADTPYRASYRFGWLRPLHVPIVSPQKSRSPVRHVLRSQRALTSRDRIDPRHARIAPVAARSRA